jgi:hypothetical protein
MNNADIALYQAKDNGRGCFAYCKWIYRWHEQLVASR